MPFPAERLRRLRRTPALRRLVRETELRADDFILPLFVCPGEGIERPVGAMPGVFQHSVDRLVEAAAAAHREGVSAVILFGLPEYKDATGSAAWDDDGIVQRALRALAAAVPALVRIVDVCFCEYTDHGHCGVLSVQGTGARADEQVDNDATLENLALQAVSLARAGADVIAPSDMMDGRVGRIRRALDEAGFEQMPILAYACKFASALYGPFREAAGSTPAFGDRRGYQLDPSNGREALREAELDAAEGADLLMVKPALPYLDILAALRRRHRHPLVAYHVSGEFAMLKAAAQNGWLDYDRALMESLLAIRRAGADLVITYGAVDAARSLAPGLGAVSELQRRAEAVLPGGVSSPVRAFRGVGGNPVFVRSASGAWLEGADGRRYIDYIGGYGPHILGHSHPEIVAAIVGALARGTSFGAPTEAEVELGELIVSALPAVEMVRLVCSGTEATMSALRLARAATGRAKLVKFEGCYHGHADAFLVAAGSGAATIGVPSSPGVPAAVTADTLVAPYNDLEAVAALFQAHGGEIAAVFVEPVAGNMGLVPPEPGYLEGLRQICSRFGALLVFDEVMTGFRVAWGGAQNLFGVEPDLTTLGKVIGGGLPLAAYGGPRELMKLIAPSGPVYQAGTLSGNPLAVAAGLAALRRLRANGGAIYQQLEDTATVLQRGLEATADHHRVPCTVQRQGSMIGLFFTAGPVRRLSDVAASDHPRFARVFHRLLAAGVHLPPSPYEALFLSAAHGGEEIAYTVRAFDSALAEEAATS